MRYEPPRLLEGMAWLWAWTGCSIGGAGAAVSQEIPRLMGSSRLVPAFDMEERRFSSIVE